VVVLLSVSIGQQVFEKKETKQKTACGLERWRRIPTNR